MKLTKPQRKALELIKATEPARYEFNIYEKNKPVKATVLNRLVDTELIYCHHNMSGDWYSLTETGQAALLETDSSAASGYREIAHSSESPEWYTPVQYIDAARFVMGGIELDPASTEEANLTVKAARYYTKTDDGLSLDWTAASVYCNPPGSGSGRSAQAEWFAKAEKEYLEGRAKEIVFCMFNSSGTQTKWYQAMFGNYPICFPDHRIKFAAPAGTYENEEEKDNSPVHASAFIYLGHHDALFAAAFRQFGKVMPAFLKE